MKETLEGLRHKIERATELGAVVRSMKALSASNIHQYEQAVQALETYNRTLQSGLYACRAELAELIRPDWLREEGAGAVVFGSGQGLVGQFNDTLSHFVKGRLGPMGGEKTIWAVGDTIGARLADAGLPAIAQFVVPHSIQSITQLVIELLLEVEKALEKGRVSTVFLFYNKSSKGVLYEPVSLRFIPLDKVWLATFDQMTWQTDKYPEIVFSPEQTVRSFLREYFFVTLFRACAESLASENASRLAAMHRAERSVEELLNDLNLSYHQLRQNTIDEELFDIIAGAEALHAD